MLFFLVYITVSCWLLKIHILIIVSDYICKMNTIKVELLLENYAMPNGSIRFIDKMMVGSCDSSKSPASIDWCAASQRSSSHLCNKSLCRAFSMTSHPTWRAAGSGWGRSRRRRGALRPQTSTSAPTNTPCSSLLDAPRAPDARNTSAGRSNEVGAIKKECFKESFWIRKNSDARKLSSMKGSAGKMRGHNAAFQWFCRPNRGCVIWRRSISSIPLHPCGFGLIKSSLLQVSLFYLNLSICKVTLPSNDH